MCLWFLHVFSSFVMIFYCEIRGDVGVDSTPEQRQHTLCCPRFLGKPPAMTLKPWQESISRYPGLASFLFPRSSATVFENGVSQPTTCLRTGVFSIDVTDCVSERGTRTTAEKVSSLSPSPLVSPKTHS